MRAKFIFQSLGLFALAALLCSCASIPELGAVTDRAGPAGRKIVVHLGEQRAYLYHRDTVVAVSSISSGREGKGTPIGIYRITEMKRHHRSSIYGNYVRDGAVVQANVDNRIVPRPAGATFVGASMPYWMRFHGAYGLHAGYVTGEPASNGCVRLPERQARRFFEAVKLGTPVWVRR